MLGPRRIATPLAARRLAKSITTPDSGAMRPLSHVVPENVLGRVRRRGDGTSVAPRRVGCPIVVENLVTHLPTRTCEPLSSDEVRHAVRRAPNRSQIRRRPLRPTLRFPIVSPALTRVDSRSLRYRPIRYCCSVVRMLFLHHRAGLNCDVQQGRSQRATKCLGDTSSRRNRRRGGTVPTNRDSLHCISFLGGYGFGRIQRRDR